jgi:hypothetical protein
MLTMVLFKYFDIKILIKFFSNKIKWKKDDKFFYAK